MSLVSHHVLLLLIRNIKDMPASATIYVLRLERKGSWISAQFTVLRHYLMNRNALESRKSLWRKCNRTE